MRFDLSTGHLGDLLLLAPALRPGDSVHGLPPQHRLPQLPCAYVDERPAEPALSLAQHRPDEHRTAAWLRLTGRKPTRYTLLSPHHPPRGVVLAPSVNGHSARRWPHFDCLLARIIATQPSAYVTVITDKTPRERWMQDLAGADTVVSPDTGTAHMADALGVRRVVTLYPSPQHHRLYHTYWNREHHIVAERDMPSITVEHVMEHLQ